MSKPQDTEGLTGNFQDLFDAECQRLGLPPDAVRRPEPAPQQAGRKSTREPWIQFTTRDLFGVAFSGGGIRSATFNLGLLQAMARLRVLDHVHYLSTVSGGGYVGSFWTTWLHRNAARKPDLRFPAVETPGAAAARDPEPFEVRHLREFSRFLMPRLGFWYHETWAAVVVILAGLIPSLTAALSVLLLAVYVGVLVSLLLLSATATWSTIVFIVVTGLIHTASEYVWLSSGKSGANKQNPWPFIVLAPLAVMLCTVAWMYLRTGDLMPIPIERSLNLTDFWRIAQATVQSGQSLHKQLLLPAAAWLFGAAVLLLVRGLVIGRLAHRKSFTAWSEAVDRSVARCLVPTVIVGLMASLWVGSEWLTKRFGFGSHVGSVALSSGAGAIFFLLRDWLAKPVEETNASNLWDWARMYLKPLLPQLAALAAVFGLLLLAMLTVRSLGTAGHFGTGLTAAGAIMLATLLLFNPARVGLHDFYRARISRCFLGATHASDAKASSATSEQPDDDVTLGELRQGSVQPMAAAAAAPGSVTGSPGEVTPTAPPPGPVHLVCCAANSLSGDPLSNLYRGARSVTISPLGIALGDEYARADELRLSSAVTASAAAFNSQMGSISMAVGPAVSFVMSALNLRLGLWVSHPGKPDVRFANLVGLPFFFEMFGRSKCEPLNPQAGAQPVAGDAPGGDQQRDLTQKTAHAQGRLLRWLKDIGREFSYLHLSDGGHFENLALYELVRRHCRYVIVSDCGADADVAFDDLANAIRRIREDFGVEVEVDVEPLRPDEHGHSAQHAVVGTIHYDGLNGTDKGCLIYFKPTLTGDEPPDVLQYRTRNTTFPHESTGDQFYDEAQWESYRRLGEHCGAVVLRAGEFDISKRANFADNLFLDVSKRWQRNQEQHRQVFLDLTARCNELETDLRENAPDGLLGELFPELAGAPAAAPAREKAAGSDEGADRVRTIFYLMRVIQIMEDAWAGAELDEYWSHPVNSGWMSYFQRWASTPTFRHWWPILRPIYGDGFRTFVKERFEIRLQRGTNVQGQPSARMHLQPLGEMRAFPDGHVWTQWKIRRGVPKLDGKLGLQFNLTLEPVGSYPAGDPLAVGFLLYERHGSAGQRSAGWHHREMYVPESLDGSGIYARFLESVINYFCFEEADLGELWVDIVEGDPTGRASQYRPNRAVRLERVKTISFYKSRGFAYLPDNPQRLRLDLAEARYERRLNPTNPPMAVTKDVGPQAKV
ncbi:MAG TPA: hypothetical protein VG734_24445 [Lacunisphaera sp.]|nr:hypothetical protein [Lacunisphaera sp.]